MVFGPASLILLLAAWALGLIVSFGLLHWGLGSQLAGPSGLMGFREDLYMSGSTFFTLGLGDVTPRTAVARTLTVLESGMGFAFLALVIGYLPMISQAFSRREVNISMLDSRAGSPPTAGQLLARHAATKMTFTTCCGPGSAGRRSPSRAMSRSRSSPISARSTTTSPGSRS